MDANGAFVEAFNLDRPPEDWRKSWRSIYSRTNVAGRAEAGFAKQQAGVDAPGYESALFRPERLVHRLSKAPRTLSRNELLRQLRRDRLAARVAVGGEPSRLRSAT